MKAEGVRRGARLLRRQIREVERGLGSRGCGEGGGSKEGGGAKGEGQGDRDREWDRDRIREKQRTCLCCRVIPWVKTQESEDAVPLYQQSAAKHQSLLVTRQLDSCSSFVFTHIHTHLTNHQAA